MYQYNTVYCWLWFDVLTRPSEHPQCPKVKPKGSLVIEVIFEGMATTNFTLLLLRCHLPFSEIFFLNLKQPDDIPSSCHHHQSSPPPLPPPPPSSPAYLATTFITTLAFFQTDRFLLHKSFLVPFEPFIYFVQRHLKTEEDHEDEDDVVNVGDDLMMMIRVIMRMRRKMKMIV